MKLLLIAYNEALDEQVRERLDAAGVAGYTKWTKVYGKGRSSGPHLGTHVWPKANNVLAVVAEDDAVQRLVEDVRRLRERLSREGIKAFVLPCEAMT